MCREHIVWWHPCCPMTQVHPGNSQQRQERVHETGAAHCVQIEMHSVGEDGRLSKRAVPLIEDGSEPTPVDLRHVMPARDFFAPVGASKEAISALLDTLVAGEAALSGLHMLRPSTLWCRERHSHSAQQHFVQS